MKKKISLLLTAFLLGAALSACGSNAEEKPGNENTAGTPVEEQVLVYRSNTTLADLEAYLLEKGVLDGERTEVEAEKVGAVDGFGYQDSNVEIYEYDTDSPHMTHWQKEAVSALLFLQQKPDLPKQ